MNAENESSARPLEGHMFLYEQPELLTREVHGSLGLRRATHPFGFARNARVMPITFAEFKHAQMHYPIIFADAKKPMPLAVVGGNDEVNLFVDEQGAWEKDVYIPAYARCYPFALAARSEEQFAVVIDRAAEMVSDAPEHPFFDGDKVTPRVQSAIDFCGQYDAERRRTIEFCRRLSELQLLTGHEAARTLPGGERQPIASYVAVDSAKLADLDAETLHEIFQSGYLAGIFAHLFSLDNWQRILERLALRAQSA